MDFSNVKKITISAGEVKQIEINGVVVWRGYTNLVPTSTDTDGSIFNGVGYKENVRLSSSGGVSGSAQAGSVTTGFMPYTYDAPFIVRMKGALWVGMSDNSAGGSSGTHWYINFYDADKNFLAGIAASATSNYTSTLNASYDETTGVTTFDFTGVETPTAMIDDRIKTGAFIRINAKGNGADLIVTVNEEIA